MIMKKPRNMTARALALTFVLLIALPLVARTKTDVVVMKNGDHLTGEIKGLSEGVLYLDMEYILGTSSVQWSKVEHLESKQLFLVKTENGSVYTGTLSTAETSDARPVQIQVVEASGTQVVIDIETGSADGWFLVEGSMRSMPVVLVNPRSQMAKAFGGVLVEAGVGPLADGGLDEAFGLAIGAWGVDASAGVLELEIAAGLREQGGAEARAVVGHDAADRDAEVGEVGHGLAEEAAGGGRFFVRQQGGEGDAGVVVDGDIKKLPAGAAGFILGIAGDAMAGLGDAGQLLDVDVQQVAGSGVLVAHDGHGGFQHLDLVQLEAGQDAAHGGPAQAFKAEQVCFDLFAQ